MIGVRAFGLYQHRRSEDFQALLDQVRRLKVGCVVVFESEVGSLPTQINACSRPPTCRCSSPRTWSAG
jgi:hypothetical protein